MKLMQTGLRQHGWTDCVRVGLKRPKDRRCQNGLNFARSIGIGPRISSHFAMQDDARWISGVCRCLGPEKANFAVYSNI